MIALLTNVDFWKNLGSVLWPIVTLIIFFAGKNLIGKLFTKDQISIEVAGMKLNLADAAKNIGKDLADLQQKVASIEQSMQNAQKSAGTSEILNPSLSLPTQKSLSIIWVDDFPSNNAFLVDRLQQDGINIELSLSTSDALEKIRSRSYNAIISDLGRKEDGQNKPMAGLDLIKSLRGSGEKTPILIYAGRRGLENKEILINAGANIVSASGTEVIKFVKDIQKSAQGKI